MSPLKEAGGAMSADLRFGRWHGAQSAALRIPEQLKMGDE